MNDTEPHKEEGDVPVDTTEDNETIKRSPEQNDTKTEEKDDAEEEEDENVPVDDTKENKHEEDDEAVEEMDEAEKAPPEHKEMVKDDSKGPDHQRESDGDGDDMENNEEEEIRQLTSIQVEEAKETDPAVLAQIDLMEKSTPSTDLEKAYHAALKRKEIHLSRLTSEIIKLKQFISKRKQTYKRKRKDDGAPTRALSAYNIYIQDRFARLAKENENALKSEDKDATLKRVPPASLVAATGNAWKTLSVEEKQKYEERAKSDRKRYETQMAEYQPPDKQSNRKRNKTGYNMFFSAHVLRLKQTESGVPSERGSVARLVGTAWKLLAQEEKAYYEREADKHNGMHPVKEGGGGGGGADEEDDEEEEIKRQQMEYHMHAVQHGDMSMHPGMPPPMHGMPHPHHDARQHHHGYYPPHMYAPHPPPPYGHYDYSQHHQRHQQARAQGYQQAYPPPPRHPYEG